MATVREEQDEVVKGLVVTLLANSKNVNDVAELGVDILERAPQGRHAFRAIQLPPPIWQNITGAVISCSMNRRGQQEIETSQESRTSLKAVVAGVAIRVGGRCSMALRSAAMSFWLPMIPEKYLITSRREVRELHFSLMRVFCPVVPRTNKRNTEKEKCGQRSMSSCTVHPAEGQNTGRKPVTSLKALHASIARDTYTFKPVPKSEPSEAHNNGENSPMVLTPGDR